MDAITYLKEKSRLTNKCKINCAECKLGMEEEYDCEDFELNNPEKVVEIIEQWAKDCLEETVWSDFKKKFPNAPTDSCGFPNRICPTDLNNNYMQICDSPFDAIAEDCTRCWQQPLIKE